MIGASHSIPKGETPVERERRLILLLVRQLTLGRPPGTPEHRILTYLESRLRKRNRLAAARGNR